MSRQFLRHFSLFFYYFTSATMPYIPLKSRSGVTSLNLLKDLKGIEKKNKKARIILFVI